MFKALETGNVATIGGSMAKNHWARLPEYVNGWIIEPGLPGPYVIRAFCPIEGRIVRFANARTLRSARLFAKQYSTPTPQSGERND